jgi:N-acetylmuramic acid 6-phosphate etherase
VNSVSQHGQTSFGTAGKTRYLLGVDGGGTKTVALIAALDEGGQITVLGRGKGGPSNLRLSGKEQSLNSLDEAINEARIEAGLPEAGQVCAVMALAGSTSPDVQQDICNWAKTHKYITQLEIVHDALPVLATGTADGQGIALIVGTGSVAVGVDINGKTVTKGGWGHWFGDKGSGFHLGYRALAAVAEASDEIGPETLLSELVLEVLGTADARSILKEVSAGDDTRRAVAALAPVVLDAAARNDKVAMKIVQGAVTEAVKLVAAVAKALSFEGSYPLALAGGVVCRSELFRNELMSCLNKMPCPPNEVTLVNEPVSGCLKMARAKLMESDQAPTPWLSE